MPIPSVPNASFATATVPVPASQVDANFAYLTAASFDSAGPAWASYTTLYDAARYVINSYPVTAQFGNNTVGVAEAIMGGVEIPSTAAGSAHCSGVAGYARTASTAQGAVGVFGAAMCNTNGSSMFGANFLVTNSPTPQSLTSTGFTNTNLYGIEIDVNLNKLGGGASPNSAVRGIYLTGASEVQSTAYSRAIEVGLLGVLTGVKWTAALYTDDAAADYALNIGTTGTGNSVGSQPIRLRSRNAGATDLTTDITADPDGNVAINAAGAVFSYQAAGVDQFRVVSKVIQSMDALKALGGGAAPTLGTIGGSGPAAGAQNSWAKFLDSTGAAFYVPVWK